MRKIVLLPALCALILVMGISASRAAEEDKASIRVDLEAVHEKIPCGATPEFLLHVSNLSDSPIKVLDMVPLNLLGSFTEVEVFRHDSMQYISDEMSWALHAMVHVDEDDYVYLEPSASIQLELVPHIMGFDSLPPGKYLIYVKYVPDPFSQHSRNAHESNKITYEVVDNQHCRFISFAEVSNEPSIKIDLEAVNERIACGAMPELVLSVYNFTAAPIRILNIASREPQLISTALYVRRHDSMPNAGNTLHMRAYPRFSSTKDYGHMELEGHGSVQFKLLVEEDMGFHSLSPGKYVIYARYVTDPFSNPLRDVYESSGTRYEVADGPECTATE